MALQQREADLDGDFLSRLELVVGTGEGRLEDLLRCHELRDARRAQIIVPQQLGRAEAWLQVNRRYDFLKVNSCSHFPSPRGTDGGSRRQPEDGSERIVVSGNAAGYPVLRPEIR